MTIVAVTLLQPILRQACQQAALKKFVTLPRPLTKECQPKERPSARILTSAECRHQMTEKEQKEEKRCKEENLRKRELKCAESLMAKQATKPGEDALDVECTA